MKNHSQTILAAAALAGLFTGCANAPKKCDTCKPGMHGEKGSCAAKGQCSSKTKCTSKGNCASQGQCASKSSCSSR